MKLEQPARLYRWSCLLVASSVLVLLAGADDSSAGIQGTGRFAMGPITATGSDGSIVVEGTEYGTSQARIKIDGHIGPATQLRVGQIVTVRGTSLGSGRGNATDVAFTGSVVGPIDHIDAAGGTFTVLGQTVIVDASTLFGDGIQPAALGGLHLGTDVEVSAFPTASGQQLASRVDLQTAGAPLQVQGLVQTLNADTQTFHINGLTVDYSQAAVTGPLANGNTVTVVATEYPSAGTLHATKVQASNDSNGVAGLNGQVEGLITSMPSQSDFFIGSQLIVTNSSTHFVLHGNTLGPNLEVKVTGTFDSSGALVADQVHSDQSVK